MTDDKRRTDPAVPRYAYVESQLRQRITSGEWAPGQAIPAEKALCTAYGVSRITIRHALQRLVNSGLLIREQGRGTYVREPGLTARTRSVRSFTAEMHDLGMKPGSRLLSLEEMAAPADVAAALRLDVGARVIRAHRVRLGDGQPIGVQNAYLVAERFPELTGIALDGESLYSVLQTNYGVIPEEAQETFTAGLVSQEEARLLKVPVGAPAFYVERVTYDGRLPFEYVASVMRGDRYQVTVTIRNT
ncbi:GntR family transcriptional regulator [Actinoallomurus acaciae]|uniref:GntR family transcriptional regulator n=1 Tax=Actinoallomurus acaciae TaxID=502577 RepID=A0ABV5YL30_9ACTN